MPKSRTLTSVPDDAKDDAATRGERQRGDSTMPVTSLRVTPLVDPVLDSLGHDPRSVYVERFWLSILGPSATLLLRRLAQHLEDEPDGFELDPQQCALELGLGTRGGRHSPFWRTLDRTGRFGMTQRNGDLLAVRRRLPPLTARQVERLPEHLHRHHDTLTTAPAPPRAQVRRRGSRPPQRPPVRRAG